ncbi:DUF2934 domain-containing protein [Bradyrhizobium cenepequi]|uniref:DUF2934 domain-containing protein n=1 Tax=Bradyrhizobium cenepequi TaxID=2821403 RepID=UPI001CE2CA22|nr:DUF2934 domain-containing protein [Bradyrhizobium cenepequi]
MQDLEHAIRERAYQLWIEDGCQDGHATAHWLLAQREILSSSLEAIARVTLTEQQPKKLAKAKASRRKQRAT